jgi:septal ring factor EnvC (AmiA/AmiB activator)
MATGCNTVRCYINRLDNVCRNRCDCENGVHQIAVSGPVAANVNGPSVLMEELPEIRAANANDEKLLKMHDQVREAEKERDLATREAAAANGKLSELQSKLATLEADRDQSLRKLQQVTEQLVDSQRQLREIEVGFTRMQADNSQTIGNLENRLARIIDNCGISSLEKPPVAAAE